ncbi:CHAD domain-containing protein [Herbihabitans rhizosphaerae]|uniref:CHAD domain-containing protein n=1 Tax=Herbihabitans rhizosphaerae TaxID=1872711 RepID=A0A4Q7L506_9PSEU|nr:CHAD domain-containing protein [Herbihabitans rhizosphaerae]
MHQMRVAVRRMRAALKAEGSTVPDADELRAELKWLGGALGEVRDFDVLLGRLREETADFGPDEQHAADRLFAGLVTDRRRARRKMLGVLRGSRYRALLHDLAEAARSDVPVVEPESGKSGKPAKKTALVDVVRKPHRKLVKAAAALPDDPPDDDLHALRIKGKRVRYAAELAADSGGKKVKKLIAATKKFQDLLGDHQDAVVGEQEVRRMLSEQGGEIDADVVFVAGRLVERERARRTECRRRWRMAVAKVDDRATALLS